MGEWRRPWLVLLTPSGCQPVRLQARTGSSLGLFPDLGKNLWTRGLSFCNQGCPQHWRHKT